MLDLKDSIKWGNKLTLKSINFHQITNAKDIKSKRLCKSKYENIIYKNYYNSQFNIDVRHFCLWPVFPKNLVSLLFA